MSKKLFPLLWSLLLLVVIIVTVKMIPHYSGVFNFAGASAGSLLFAFIGLVPGLLLGAERIVFPQASGPWKFDLTRFVSAALPLLTIGVLAVLGLLSVSMWDAHVSFFAGIGIGYLLTSSLTRELVKQTRFFFWFVWSAVLALVLFGMFRLNAHLSVTSPQVLPEEIAGLIFGVLLGLKQALFRNPGGGWHFNYVRLLLAALPLVLVFIYALELLPVAQAWLADNLEARLVKTLTSVALGYVLITSLERKQSSS